MASAPGLLYYYPWEGWGNLKYLLYLPMVAKALEVRVIQGRPNLDNICFQLLLLDFLRYLLFQVWGTMSRLPYVSRKYQIQTKGIKFEQIDHEAHWENLLLMASYILWALSPILIPTGGLPAWDWRGFVITMLVHVGPVEWIYYWGHRVLHHHFFFTRYHQHHHSSFVTQPITSNNHPLLEHLFYNVLFSLPMIATFLTNTASIGGLHFYLLFIDFMDAWGHCNFEFIPTWAFDAFPPLKYILYSPTYHSLHHTKVHTNFSLFMPIYDYIYGTVDATSDKLYVNVRKGHETKVDCVYLTHVPEVLSTFHLQFVFQKFAAQPYSKKWYMWIMWPIALPLMLLAWLFAKPFVGATHFIARNMELQTWFIPRYTFQYSMPSEIAKIDGWIQECIIEAQEAGAKVIALGLLNKDRAVDMDEDICKKGVSIPIVTGDILTTAIVAKEVEATCHKGKDVFITSAHSRVGKAISACLCERGFRVLAHFPSEDHAKNVREHFLPKYRDNLVCTTNYSAGKSCKVWIVGEQIGSDIQRLAPKGTHFHQFAVFPIQKWRKDCSYGSVPGLMLPKNAQNINACEDVMPRNVVRASYAAAIVHALEGLHYHDLSGDIPIDLVHEYWEMALKHGFSMVGGEEMTLKHGFSILGGEEMAK